MFDASSPPLAVDNDASIGEDVHGQSVREALQLLARESPLPGFESTVVSLRAQISSLQHQLHRSKPLAVRAAALQAAVTRKEKLVQKLQADMAVALAAAEPSKQKARMLPPFSTKPK